MSTGSSIRGPYAKAAVLLALLSLPACAKDVRAESVTASTKDQVTSDVGKSTLGDDDKKLYLAALLRSSFGAMGGNYSLEGKTVGQILDDQKKWQANYRAEQDAAHDTQVKTENEKTAMIDEMRHVISIQPISKRFKAADMESGEFEDKEFVNLQFHNIGSKQIAGVKGGLVFTNSFGDKVISLAVEAGGSGNSALRLAPNDAFDSEYSWDANKFDDQWKAFREAPLSSMKAEWRPEQIIFGDGTTLKSPDDSSQ